jgi:putative transposase
VPALKREVADYVISVHRVSEHRSCKLSGISRRTYRYQSIKEDTLVIDALSQAVELHPGYGFWKLYHTLRRKGHGWNHKRVYRVYCSLKLNIRRRVRKRLPRRVPQPLAVPQAMDMSWSMDLMHDSLYSGRRFRLLNIVDDFNRECLAMEVATSINSNYVVRILDRLKAEGRKPQQIRVDNGPEFLAGIFQHWCQVNQVKLHYIQPGKPTQNSYVERFNGSCRRELLDMYVFENMQEVEQLVWKWKEDYNYNRPHESLGFKTPVEIREQFV